MPEPNVLPSAIRGTGALHGTEGLHSSRSPSFSQQPRDAQQRPAVQSLHARGRASSAPPEVHQQRGRTRIRGGHHTAAPSDDRPLDDTQRSSSTPPARNRDSFMDQMQTRQEEQMQRQFEMQRGMEAHQSAMMAVKTSAEIAKLTTDTLTSVTEGFMDSAKKVMEEGSRSMRLERL